MAKEVKKGSTGISSRLTDFAERLKTEPPVPVIQQVKPVAAEPATESEQLNGRAPVGTKLRIRKLLNILEEKGEKTTQEKWIADTLDAKLREYGL